MYAKGSVINPTKIQRHVVSELSRVSSGLGHVRVSPSRWEIIAEPYTAQYKETKCLMGLWIFEATFYI